MKEKEDVISETEGVFTTNIRVTELRDKILLRIILLLLVWPVIIIASFAFVLIMPEEYLAITLTVAFLSFLWIIPIAVIVRIFAKQYHKSVVYVERAVSFVVKRGNAYMNDRKVKVMIDHFDGSEYFKIYTSRFEGYALDIRDTEEFRIFLENNRIPYV